MNFEQMHYDEIFENELLGTWDDPATPIDDLPIAQPIENLPQNIPVIDPNGWHWYPDSNGQLFTLYFDADGNECMMWRLQDDGSFYWRCANVGYTCRDIGIDGRRGIFFHNHLVGSMMLDQHLTVSWLPETYINQIHDINDINDINYNDIIQYENNINYNDIIQYENNIEVTDIEDDFDP